MAEDCQSCTDKYFLTTDWMNTWLEVNKDTYIDAMISACGVSYTDNGENVLRSWSANGHTGRIERMNMPEWWISLREKLPEEKRSILFTDGETVSVWRELPPHDIRSIQFRNWSHWCYVEDIL